MSGGVRSWACRPYGALSSPYRLVGSSMTALGNRSRQRGNWGLVGLPGGRYLVRSWDVRRSGDAQEVEDGLVVDRVHPRELGEVGAFVDAVQPLVRHAEAGGRRDSVLARQQVADVAGPCGLRPH